MQEAQRSFRIFIQEMRNDILVLLRFLNGEKGVFDTLDNAIVLLFVIVISTFERGKLRVDTHQPSNATDVDIREAF
jgi:hypothetical protein